MVTVGRGREPTKQEGFCDGAVVFTAFPPPLSLMRSHPGRQIGQHNIYIQGLVCNNSSRRCATSEGLV